MRPSRPAPGPNIRLPDELWLAIFSLVGLPTLVDKVAKVCREWERVAGDAALWRDEVELGSNAPTATRDMFPLGPGPRWPVARLAFVDNSRRFYGVKPALVTSVALHCAATLRAVRFVDCPGVTTDVLLAFAAACTGVEEMTVENCDASDGGWLEVAGPRWLRLASLALDMGNISAEEANVTDEHLACIRAKSFSTLRLRKCGDLYGTFFASMRALTVLELDQCMRVDLKEAGWGCPKLQSLTVYHDYPEDEADSDFRGLDLGALFSGAVALTSLDVQSSTLSDEDLAVAGAHCPALQRLDLRECTAVTIAGVRAFAPAFPCLREVYVEDTGVTGAEWKGLKARLPALVCDCE
jgi:hypothetical protein